jgi:general secretion pathway protein G
MKSKKAFTMIELIFVIVVIGILAAVAVPKLAMNRNDAIIAKAKATVSAVRSALATERQKRILRGDFDKIYQLSSSSAVNSPIFDAFDGNTSNPVLEYGPFSCKTAGRDGCWEVTTLGTEGGTAVYAFNMPMTGTAVVFTLDNNRFDCTASDANCRKLTQ